MTPELVTETVPAVTTWWGGVPVKVKLIILIDPSQCLIELQDYQIHGWGSDNTLAGIDVGVSFDVSVNETDPYIEECAEPKDTCFKTLSLLISTVKIFSLFGKEFRTPMNDVKASFFTKCYEECCEE